MKMVKLVVLILSLCVMVTCEKANSDSMINAYNSIFSSSNSAALNYGDQYNQTSDIYATSVDFARKYGYPVETHTVVTNDGYLLTVHRIPGSPRSPSSTSKKPVLLQHGIFSCSDTWLLTGPEQGLGFILADQGFDVWLGNARGNYYSKKHVSLSQKDPAFWNFSVHEMGVYDLPAVIDHILKVTGHKQLFYVGHSMGNTMFFIMASRRPEYNQKIRLKVALAPVVYLKRIPGTLLLIYQYFPDIYRFLKMSGQNVIFPRTPDSQRSVGSLCRAGNPTLRICLYSYVLSFGGTTKFFNMSMAPVVFSHLLAGASVNTVAHYLQMYSTGRFQEFDPSARLGKSMPSYDLAKVTAPVALYYAVQDSFVHPDTIAKMKSELPNVIRTVSVACEETSHIDFVFGTQAKEYIYDEVIAVMKQYL